MKKLRNVILIGIDSLRFDRIPMGGYKYNTCPTLSDIAYNGICCVDAVSHSGPTQFALPTVFTSTLPLDCGGYDNGIMDRPVSLPEIFKDYSYKTHGWATNDWISDLGGYSRGFDELINVFDLANAWRNADLYYSYYDRILKRGLIDEADFIRLVKDYLVKTMRFTIFYCGEELGEVALNDHKYEDIYKYDFNALSSIMFAEFEELEQNPENYINKNFDKLSHLDYFFTRCGKRVLKNGVVGLLDRINVKALPALRLKHFLYKNWVSAEYLTNRAIYWIEHNRDLPFFLWLYFDDVHEGNCSTGKGKCYHKGINRHLRASGRPERFNQLVNLFRRDQGRSVDTDDIRYDASVKYVDDCIGKLVSFLKKKGIFEDTLLVFFSDHGVGIGANKRSGILTASLFEEYIRVPLIFYYPGIESKTVEHQCGLIDLAPTIIDLLGMNQVDKFKGVPVYSERAAKREYIFLENLSRGPCDLVRKPITVGIRTKEWKYIFREFDFHEEKEPLSLVELYDLRKDPLEKENLANSRDCMHIVEKFEGIAKQRCHEIRRNGETGSGESSK
jgi:hypothetical protein